jgi:hypothetical protein
MMKILKRTLRSLGIEVSKIKPPTKPIETNFSSIQSEGITDLKFSNAANEGTDVDFLLLRSYGSDNVLARIQSDPLIEGLAIHGKTTATAIYCASTDTIVVSKPKWIIVHFDDTESILRARDIKKITNCKIACLGSDIYKLDRYVGISEVVDIFLMPTELHRAVLQSAVWIDVFVLPEAVDPIAYPASGQQIAVQKNDQLCWFGYPESFEKSMRYMLNKALTSGNKSKQNLTLITAANVNLIDGVKHLPFDEKTFYQSTSNFSYALLSHFAFDCHLNSYIKSPNKLVTSLVRGMIPLTSNTPSYREIMRQYNLEEFMYGSGPELAALLGRIDQQRDASTHNFANIANALKSQFSPQSNAGTLLAAIG